MFGESSKGRTAVFDAAYVGSIPASPAKFGKVSERLKLSACKADPFGVRVFESHLFHHSAIAQLARAFACPAKGYGFNSRWHCHFIRPHRLTVRTSGFRPENRDSNSRGVTNARVSLGWTKRLLVERKTRFETVPLTNLYCSAAQLAEHRIHKPKAGSSNLSAATNF